MKLLILSDVHANWPALEAVLRAEPDFDAVAFCGDAVGFGPCPVECTRWLRAHVRSAVRGNHDNALAFDQDCRCRGTFRELGRVTRAWHRTILGQTERTFLRGLPTLDWFEWEGRHFRVAHATPYGGLFDYVPLDEWGDRVRELAEDFILLGHSRVQGMRRFGSLAVVNPGSVGLARDGGGQACYAVFADDRVTLKRTPYDVDRVIRLLSRAPLDEWVFDGLVDLYTGWSISTPGPRA
jgi:putative phosphoesterase